MRASYHPDYYVELPPGHAFPMGKFPALAAILEREGIVRREERVAPAEASWEELELVHTREFLARLRDGTMSRGEERRMGLPWSPALVRRSRLAVRGTVNAAWMALEDGVAANLAGGTHHAFPDHAEGFCVLNDVAVAIRILRRSGWIERALVIDLDVHQGNGVAQALADDPASFTVSLHGARNYPFQKVPSDLDIALADDTGDDAYLSALHDVLKICFREARPDVLFYLAGVDVVEGDRFGRLRLTREGLATRDRAVLTSAREAGVPVALLLSGGYAASAEATADLHATAHRMARRVFGESRSGERVSA